MRVKTGWIVKVPDIGTPAKVLKTQWNKALVEFDFQDGRETVTIPVSLISTVLER